MWAVVGALADNTLTLTLLPDDVANGARCLDGTPFGVYVRPAPAGSANASNWVLWLQGGGLCITPIDCALRLKTDMGSSNYFNPTRTDTVNILSGDPQVNPHMHDWNVAFFPYCTGDTWNGLRTDAAPYDLYFAGHHNLVAGLKHLQIAHGLGRSQGAGRPLVVLGGGSAGGIGVFGESDFVQESLPTVDLLALPYGGLFFPANVSLYEEWVVGVDEPINVPFSNYVADLEDAYLHPRCVAAVVARGGSEDECWDANVALRYTQVPTFMVENMWDQLQIQDVLLLPPDAPDFAGYVNYFGARVRATVASVRSLNPAAFTGAWVPSCFAHTNDLCTRSPATVQGVTLNQAIGPWLAARGRPTTPRYYVDDCVTYPTCTTTCVTYCG